ncbi:MAG: hypothetical protein QOE08_587, partial [Thermoleophilaceae bacterium]|nr:hypothetical protein [Thermoleophilaceae bacterium]
MARGPDIAVVIPTRERWPVLRRTLEALAAQELGELRAEVVVVDNGSLDGSLEQLRAHAHESAAVRVFEEPIRGAAAARNRGIAEALAPLVLFLGDDCVPAGADLVLGHAEAHSGAGPVRAVAGGIEWDPSLPRTRTMDWLERAGHMVDLARLRGGAASAETFYTGNVSIPRAALLEVAGFDQRFAGYGFEDLDLGLRLADRGVGFQHRPDLLVRHAHSYGFGESVERMEAVGRGARLLHRLHDHRRPLPGPPAGRRRLAAGLALGPLRRFEPPPLLPSRAIDLWLRAAHLAAFAHGYTGPELPSEAALRGYGAVPRSSDQPRPDVSVVVPFLGDAAAARDTLAQIGQLRMGPGDEAILVDNGGTVGQAAGTA